MDLGKVLTEEMMSILSEDFSELLESYTDVDVLAKDIAEVLSEGFEDIQNLDEANIIKFDKKTKLKIAVNRAAIMQARAKKDRLYYETTALKKAYKEKMARLRAKFGAQGLAAVRKKGSDSSAIKGVSSAEKGVIDQGKLESLVKKYMGS